jgi:uncharacterized membrane protein YidH (DUF202 family)
VRNIVSIPHFLLKTNGAYMSNKVIGIILIVVGVALAAWGYNIYNSAGSQFSRALSGDAPIEAWAGMAGGVICIVFGILKVK